MQEKEISLFEKTRTDQRKRDRAAIYDVSQKLGLDAAMSKQLLDVFDKNEAEPQQHIKANPQTQSEKIESSRPAEQIETRAKEASQAAKQQDEHKIEEVYEPAPITDEERLKLFEDDDIRLEG